jgi:hypothetical protein
MTRLRRITAHHAPHSEFQNRAGFGKLASPANQRLDRFSLLVGQAKRDAILAYAEPVILLPGRPFTLTRIHEICTKFNEGYGMHPGIDRFGLHKRVSQDLLGRISLDAIVQKRTRARSNSVGFRRLTTTTRWSAVGGGLDAVQLRVLTVFGHQLIVRAHLHEPGAIKNDNEIGHADRRETV